MEDKDHDDNIVSIAEARRRQKVLRKGANGKDPDHGKVKPKASSQGRNGSRIFFYIQFAVFLVVLAYMMQLCRGG